MYSVPAVWKFFIDVHNQILLHELVAQTFTIGQQFKNLTILDSSRLNLRTTLAVNQFDAAGGLALLAPSGPGVTNEYLHDSSRPKVPADTHALAAAECDASKLKKQRHWPWVRPVHQSCH
jgi:hypothetical protein